MSKKALILFTVFIDILGIGIVIPILPFYVKSFGASDLTVTLLFSVFALFSFVSAPFLGSLSDRLGRRPILLASIASTAAGWFIFASAQSVLFLFLGRIIDGLAAGNISTAQSYLSDVSENEKERTHNLGLIGAMFGIGLIVGPFIGGFLGSINHTLPFWVVAILATLNLILALFRLPETHKPSTPQTLELNPFKPIVRAASDRALLPGYVAWLFFSIATSMQYSVFALYLGKIFNYQEFVAGLFLAGMGVMVALNQAVFMKHFWIKKFKEPDLEIYMCLLFGAGYLAMAFHSLAIFIIGLIAAVFGQAVLRVVMTSQMVGAAGARRGETLGVLNSVMSLGMIVGPAVAGLLFDSFSSGPFLGAALFAIGAFGILSARRKKLIGVAMPEDVAVNFPM